MSMMHTRNFAAQGDSLLPINSIAQTDAFEVAPSVTMAKGTVVAQNTTTRKLVPYVNGGANGTGTAIGLLKYAVTTDADGFILNTQIDGDVIKTKTVAVYLSGKFQAYTVNPTTGLPTTTTLLPGLDATAIGQLGKLIANVLSIPAA